MTTTPIPESPDHVAEKNRSYDVRRQVNGGGHDFSWRDGPHVYVVARRDFVTSTGLVRIAKGERFLLVSTSNAGFNGITALGHRPGDSEFVHLGSLGAYDVEAAS